MLVNSLKVACKVLLRRKLFTLVSLFGIALTLGVLLVATAYLDQVFGPRAPETRVDRTLGIYDVELRGPNNDYSGLPGYLLYERHLRSLAEMPEVERVAVLTPERRVATYLGGEKVELELKRTDGHFWHVHDFRFLEGDPFDQQAEIDGDRVAVINASTRRRLFGSGPAIGEAIEVDAQRFEVVGVVEDVSALREIPYADVWVPISTLKSSRYRHSFMDGFVVLLLARERRDFAAIRAEVARRFAEAEVPEPELFEELRGRAETPFERFARLRLGGAVGETHDGRLRRWMVLLTALFMLLPSLNLVNLNVSRVLERASEIGVRRAFGASRRALLGQLLVENLVLTLLGALAGLVLALLGLRLLEGSGLIPYARYEPSWRLYAWGLLLAAVFSLFSGLYPAWRISRLHPVQALRGRSS